MYTNKSIKFKTLFLFSCALLFFFSGCDKHHIENKGEKEISFNLDLATNSGFHIITRAQSPDSLFRIPDADEFKIQLLNASGNVIREWATYSEMPHPVKLQTNKIQIKASHGTLGKSNFDAPCFSGDTTLVLQNEQENNVTLTADISNVLASVQYHENFKQRYKDYNTQIITSSDTLTFSKDETRTAFLPVEDLKVVVNLTRHDLTTYSTLATTLTHTKAAEFYRLFVNIGGQTGYEKLLISFDSTTIEKPIEIELSDNWQFVKKPYFTPAFDTVGYHSFIRGEDCEKNKFYTLVTAVGKIGSCKIKTNSPSLIKAGWPAEVDLLRLTNADKNCLNQFGFTWSENMVNANMTELDFSGIVSHLPAEDHTLTVEITDVNGQTSAPLSIHFRIIPPQFKLLQPEQPVIIRSSEFTFEVKMDGGNPENIVIEFLDEYLAFGVKEWVPCTIKSWEWNDTQDKILLHTQINMNKSAIQFRAKYDKQYTDNITLEAKLPTIQIQKEGLEWAHRVNLSIKQLDDINTLVQNSTAKDYFIEFSEAGNNWETANHKEITIDETNKLIKLQAVDLDDGKKFYVRAGFNTKTDLGVSYSTPITIETEAATQLPNGRMEDWYYTRPNGVQYWEVYYACKDGETPVWNTMNQLTTSEGGTHTEWTNRDGCRYSANSGTIPTTDAHNSQAALIRTVGWGKGNSAAAISGMGTCQHITPGQLYLGTYNASTPQYGYLFTSRPNKLKFYYKYIPKNQADYGYVEIKILDHSGNTLASNSMNLTAQDTYSAIELPLDYNRDSTIKAASMYIVFKSSNNNNCLTINENNLTPPPPRNTDKGEYLGSQLYIDDIELIYE